MNPKISSPLSTSTSSSSTSSSTSSSSSSSSSDGISIINGGSNDNNHSTSIESNSFNQIDLKKQIQNILNQKKMKLMNSPEVVEILRQIQKDQQRQRHSK